LETTGPLTAQFYSSRVPGDLQLTVLIVKLKKYTSHRYLYIRRDSKHPITETGMAEVFPENEWNLLQELHQNQRIWDQLQSQDEPEFRVQERLRKDHSAEFVRSALTIAGLRIKAQAKFSLANKMWFHRQGLEQSTSEQIAKHVAQRFSGRVFDFCSGIGGDAVALAERCSVFAVDRNPVNALFCKWNAEVHGVSSNVHTICADVNDIKSRDGFLRIDPDRRTGPQKRAHRIEDYEPPLNQLQQLMTEFPGGAIKLGPACNFMGQFPNSEIELISLNGECKEATVWFGELAGNEQFRATVLPAGASIAGNPMDAFAPVAELQNFIYDPDPAVVRSGLVNQVAEDFGFSRLDPEEEYLTSETLIESPFARGFEVLAELPNQSRTIRQYFRDQNFGQVEIKCRRIPTNVEAVRRKLSLKGSEPAVLIFARIDGKAKAVICRRIDAHKKTHPSEVSQG